MMKIIKEKWGINMRYLLVFMVIALVASIGSGDDFTGARPMGMGRTFVGVADDINSIDWNPAGISSFRYLTVIAGFNRLYWGISGDNIGIGHFAVANQYKTWFGYGLSWRTLFSDVYSEHHIKFALAHRFGYKSQGYFGTHPFCLGLTVRMQGIGYNEANFVDNEDDPGGMTIAEDLNTNLGGTSKWGFSLDAGALWKLSSKIAVGVSASDILQPNMAINPDDENGKVPMQIRLGASYTLNRDFIIAADGRYYKEGSTIITPHFGLEKWFYKHSVAGRAGFNPDEMAFGLGWRLNREWALQIDYAFIYPLSKLAAAGATSHKFTAMFQVPNPIPIWDLSAISVNPQMTRIKPGDEVTVNATFKNGSGNKVKQSKYSAYVRKPDGTYELLSTGEIDAFKSGQERDVTFSFTGFQPGEYTVFAAVDDNGTVIPSLDGTLDELDEGNNIASSMIKIFPAPIPKISFQQDTLHITRLTFQETEMPVIPVMFFEKNSAQIGERYSAILDKLAERMGNNPDIVVKIAGYYDPDSEKGKTELGQQREDAVFNYLKGKLGSDKQLVKNEENDPLARRAGGGKAYAGIEKYLPMIEAENRRVELIVEMPSLTQSQVEQVIKFKDGEMNKQVDFSSQALTYKSILERNPDVMLLIEGYASDREGPNLLEPAFTRAANLKEQIKKVVPFYLWDRIFAWGADRESADQPYSKISLLADGITYKPFEGRRFPKGETVENPSNFVEFSVQSDNPIVSHRAELLELAGNQVKQIVVGDKAPPGGNPWDWKLDDGNYLKAGTYYVGHISVTDELGAIGEAYSETLLVDQVDKVLGVETMLIVIFKFDKDDAISPYYHSRMEAVARRLIQLAEHEPGKLTVAVTGHTDIIGLSRRNLELSQDRGSRELDNLRIYLRHLLKLPDDNALKQWLTERQVSLITEGHGADKPYTLKKMTGEGVVEEKLLGDNNYPEGREINRRVLVEFRSELK